MYVMAGMTSIYVGTAGLKSSQVGLNTTAHNLSNVYTEGYTRQQVRYTDTLYSTYKEGPINKMQVGLGTDVQETSRVRDILLDKAYRKETGRQTFYDSQYNSAMEVERIIGETEGVAYQDSIESLWRSIAEMAKTPDSLVSRASLIKDAEAFLGRATAIYTELEDYQRELDTKVINTVEEINKLGNTIHDLNMQISAVESGGTEHANDLRDKRDYALDQLGALIDIQYTEHTNSIVTVKAEGNDFVAEDTVFRMEVSYLNGDKNSSYATPTWPHLDDVPVFKFNLDISTAKDNDIGELKGLLMARGDYVADYTDIPQEPVEPVRADFATEPDYVAAVVQYNQKLKAYHKEVETYNYYVDKSVVMKAQALLDKLANGVAEAINEVLSPNKTISLTIGGKTYDDVLVLDEDNASHGYDAAGNPAQGIELFSRDFTARYADITDDAGNTYRIYNNDSNYDKLHADTGLLGNSFGNKSLYSLKNMLVNPEAIENNYSKLPFTNNQLEMDLTMGEKLMKVWDSTFDNLDPNNLTPLNFKSFYQETVYEIANMGDLFQSVAENQEKAASTIDASRKQITDVSSEEELTNMIKFQSAYNASSRYITTVAEMLEHIIERLGA